MSAPFRLLERLLAEEERRLIVRGLELAGQEAAIRARIDELAQQRAALEAQIDEKKV
jgi:hypothetical protein